MTMMMKTDRDDKHNDAKETTTQNSGRMESVKEIVGDKTD